ncbi:hypothetical protein HOLleu_24168 [Holothuria leucospilota]|uniref:Uncharacterized protein n=1 Tax=Holothuria leucospilota TaxID=206669 RepID=A0A9Q1BVV0_HOLLE|nr:hypothetical protein HOLleu_24168 [Holothuria leucospilota]
MIVTMIPAQFVTALVNITEAGGTVVLLNGAIGLSQCSNFQVGGCSTACTDSNLNGNYTG